MINLSQIMSKQVRSISSDARVAQAARHMRDGRIGSLLVEKQGTLVGIITDTDIIRRGVAESKDLAKTSVESIMTTPLVTIDSTRSVREAQDMMGDLGVRHLVVCDAGKVVGVVSARDLLVYYRSISETQP